MFGRQGKLVNLVPIDKQRHLENVYRWLNDPEVTTGLKVGAFPLTRSSEEEWFDRMGASRTDAVFAIELLEDGRHIGMTGVHQIDFRHGTCVTGSFIGSPEDRSKGYGTDMVMARSAFCFDVLGLRLLKSGHYSGNEASRRMQEKCGYVPYGLLKEAFFSNGKYLDMVLTCLHRSRWQEFSGLR
ncbi:MAG: GNAT family N-acetyltransferase [Fimbriimonadaceae bacterium]|jgi:RimJ/RimL family protein N-acetyltransferase|nr:GNAT family N-acetyltransferase [Fimbriimonadaceae bacterium]